VDETLNIFLDDYMKLTSMCNASSSLPVPSTLAQKSHISAECTRVYGRIALDTATDGVVYSLLYKRCCHIGFFTAGIDITSSHKYTCKYATDGLTSSL